MRGLMQEWPLTLDKILDHAALWHGSREIVSREADGSVHRTTYAAAYRRAKQVSNALRASGIVVGDRVATLGWNGHRHLEAWYGVIGIGAVCHTINPRLFIDQIEYIVHHAADRILFADPACAMLTEEIVRRCPAIETIVFLCDRTTLPQTKFPAVAYDDWIASCSAECEWGGFDENTASGLCYTSGTTGNPKGVLYSHRSNFLHALMTQQVDAHALSALETVLLVVPMYHANAWGVVYSAPAVGAKMVLPGPRMDGASLHQLIESEGVTYSAAVPTVWQSLLQHLKDTQGRLTALKRVMIGGSACPESMIRSFRDDYGVDVVHAWGMTETSPLATVSTPNALVAGKSEPEQMAYKVKQGRLLCGLEVKLTDDAGRRLAHDGQTPGRLKIKGPTIAAAYYGTESGALLDEEGFLDTGDVSTIDDLGYMQITDRAKDVIKSGGEWISSITIESIVMGHPAVERTAVIGVPHPKWGERPLLLVQLCKGRVATSSDLLSFLDGRIARWWMPDDVVFVTEIPLGATGKIDKKRLREHREEFFALSSPTMS
jgi:fatty-acyl-CoA synthase